MTTVTKVYYPKVKHGRKQKVNYGKRGYTLRDLIGRGVYRKS